MGVVSVLDQRMVEKFKEMPEFAEAAKKDNFEELFGSFWISNESSIYRTIRSISIFHLAAKFNDHRGKMSGTSMATPAVVGIVAGQIYDLAKAQNIKTEDIYDHPQFTPDKLIVNLNNIGSPVFPENTSFPFKKIDVRGKYDRGSQIQALDIELNKILKN